MVKIIPISKEYRENWPLVFGEIEETHTEVLTYEPYGAVGILGYPGWCVPVDMRRIV